jgi:hypothetical protein
MVIAHDGFNDLLVGMANDPALISDYRMAYPPNFEQWAQMLQSTQGTNLNQDFSADEPLKALNSPIKVVSAYLNRKTQFANLVRGLGADFVWGLQPWSDSKEKSPNEEAALEHYYSHNVPYAELSRRLPFLYEECQNNTVVPSDVLYVDLISEFASIGPGVDCFTDFVHFTAEGNARCAAIYAKAITRSKIWESWSAGIK